jgi:hypothetical protein
MRLDNAAIQWTPQIDADLSRDWLAGVGIGQMARDRKCSDRSISRRATILGLPARAPAARLFTDGQIALIKVRHAAGDGLSDILDQINALAGTSLVITQLERKVADLKLKRPTGWTHKSASKRHLDPPESKIKKKRYRPYRRKVGGASPPPGGRPLVVPLRELIRLGGEFGVPLSHRLEVDIVNQYAWRQGHPGFILTTTMNQRRSNLIS